MIFRVMPDQIREKWHIIRPHISETLPPQLRISSQSLPNILKGLLLEKGQLWLLYPSQEEAEKGEGKVLPKAFIITTIVRDQLTGARSLVIYSFYAVDKLIRSDYIEGITGLKKFATETKCSEVLAYVEDDRFMSRLRKMINAQKVTNVVRF